MKETFNLLVSELKQFVKRSGYIKVVIGLSGGLDSSVVAVVAKEALGAKNVLGITLSSRYTSTESLYDAGAIGKELSIIVKHIPITKIIRSFNDGLAELFIGHEDENKFTE